jgi:hypothetical protein
MTQEEIEVVARAIEHALQYSSRVNTTRRDGCSHEIVAVDEGHPIVVEAFKDADQCSERLAQLELQARAVAAIAALDRHREEQREKDLTPIMDFGSISSEQKQTWAEET